MTALRDLRTARGLSLRELGQAVGVTGQAVMRWENGTAWPSAQLLPELAKTLGCSIDELFDTHENHNMEGKA